MTNELKQRISALRGIHPRLNSVTDQVSEIVRSIEKTLVEELKIGIEADEWFHSEFGGEQGLRREYYLSFSRVGAAGFRIHVSIVSVRDTSEETARTDSNETLNQEQVLWASCSREMKLKAFEKLPDLLDRIIKNAETLLQTADLTAVKIKEMVGDDEFAGHPTEAPGKHPRSGRPRGRGFSVRDARRAHLQYFLDQGLSEAAINSLPSDGWEEDGSDRFVSCDGAGNLRCSVVFEDEDGTAEVSFPDGESDSVTIDNDL
jgi:hypothetical protein